MKIAMLSYLATYGNAPLLADALRQLGHEVRLIIWTGDRYGFWLKETCGRDMLRVTSDDDMQLAAEWLPHAEKLLCMATPAVTTLLARICMSQHWRGPDAEKFAAARGGAAVFTDSHFLADPKAAITAAKKHGLQIIAAADKMQYCQPEMPPAGDPMACYWPPTEIPEIDETLSLPPILITHSPGRRVRNQWKGTREISAAMEAMVACMDGRIVCRMDNGLSHDESLASKMESDIFIDQIPVPVDVPGGEQWKGGLGKSGLEAMAASCAVIVGEDCACGDAPVTRSSAGSLTETLSALIADPEETRRIGMRCRQWAADNCNAVTVANGVETVLREGVST